MNKLEVVRRMVQWAIELSQFDIEYHPGTAIKAPALTDFMAKFMTPDDEGAHDKAKKWKIWANESSPRKRGRVGVIIITFEGDTLRYGV